MLAKEHKNENPIGYWVSEKYDGMRAVWTGDELRSRANKKIYAPEFFIKKLPKGIPLDGELFLNRASFEKTMSIVKRHTPVESDWKKIKYVLFNTPGKGTFEERQKTLKKLFPNKGPVFVAPQTRVNSLNTLNKIYKNILSKKGEGVMLRAYGSPYEQKRSKHLLKMKPKADAEAKITEIIEGKGKYAGMMGAIKVKMVNSPFKEFKLGTGFDDKQRKNLYSKNMIGKTVTFTYKDKTAQGVPRCAAFLRMFRQ